MPREDVDRTAFAGDVEGDLGCGYPSAQAQQLDEAIDHSRMVAVEETIELLSVPQHADKEPCSELGKDPLDRLNRDSTCGTALDSRDRRVRQADTPSQLALRPPTLPSQSTNLEPESNRIHHRAG